MTDGDDDHNNDDEDDKNKGMCYTWKDKEYCFQYLTVFSVTHRILRI